MMYKEPYFQFSKLIHFTYLSPHYCRIFLLCDIRLNINWEWRFPNKTHKLQTAYNTEYGNLSHKFRTANISEEKLNIVILNSKQIICSNTISLQIIVALLLHKQQRKFLNVCKIQPTIELVLDSSVNQQHLIKNMCQQQGLLLIYKIHKIVKQLKDISIFHSLCLHITFIIVCKELMYFILLVINLNIINVGVF